MTLLFSWTVRDMSWQRFKIRFSTTVEREDEETGELVTDRAHQKLFQLKSPSSKSKIDWKYTQHNIEATEGTIFRNATIYFMVQRALVQLFYILSVLMSRNRTNLFVEALINMSLTAIRIFEQMYRLMMFNCDPEGVRFSQHE